MTLKELREAIDRLIDMYDIKATVVLADSHDYYNGLSYPLDGIVGGVFYSPACWSGGEVFDLSWTHEDMGCSPQDWEDTVEDGEECVVLYPKE